MTNIMSQSSCDLRNQLHLDSESVIKQIFTIIYQITEDNAINFIFHQFSVIQINHMQIITLLYNNFYTNVIRREMNLIVYTCRQCITYV